MGTTEGILGQDYWQTVRDKQDQYAAARTGEWALNVVRPSIFSPKSVKARSPRQLRSTAYLDGLRGFAALLVYIGHHELWAHDSMKPEEIFENAYGYNDRRYFVALPGVRTFFSGGHYAVCMFFVISGYVLSTKPLQFIQAGDQLALGDSLASALFRRWLRLFIPVVCCTFLYMCSWHLLGVRTDKEAQRTFREELWKWYKEFRDYSFVFNTKGSVGLTYNFHVWSIPTGEIVVKNHFHDAILILDPEFKGSIVVYTALHAFSRLSRNARLWCTVGLMVYFMYLVDGPYCSMFLMGMLQCDLDLLAAKNDLPSPLTRLERIKKPIFAVLFAIGVYLGGCPAASQDLNVLRGSPGWHYLSYLKPEAVYEYKFFFLFCAASLTIASIPRIAPLKRFFECRFNQYLGRISYAFYLLHGPVLWTIADRLYAATGCTRAGHAMTASRWINMAPIPKIGPVGLELNFLVPQLLIFPVTLWFAEIATKLFDEPSVKFPQWLYRRALASSGKD